MQEELISVQEQLANVLESLISEMQRFTNVFTQETDGGAGPNRIRGPFIRGGLPEAAAADVVVVDPIVVSTDSLVEVNKKLITSVDNLANVMETTEGPTQIQRPTGLIQDITPLAGIGRQ